MDRMTDEERERRMKQAEKHREMLQSGQSGKKKHSRRRNRVLMIVFCVAAVVFVISVWQLGSIILNYRRGNKVYDDLISYMMEETITLPTADIPAGSDDEDEESTDSENVVYTITVPDFTYLQSVNPQICAWIQIPGTMINYPVVQGTDNEYYLTHTADGTVNSNGAIFVDALITDGFSDKNVIMYGHNMRSGAMFGTLSRYSSSSYYTSHPYIYLTTPDGMRVYQIFSAYQTNKDADIYWFGFSANDVFQEYLDRVKSYSAYDTGVSVTMYDDIITLSTCASNSSQRFIVHAKRI